jgi:site-specific DNA-methyltransferase (adenine-specific)
LTTLTKHLVNYNNENTNTVFHLKGKPKYSKDYEPDKLLPTTILDFKKDNYNGHHLHPTQKPVALFEYLIKTYTNEGDLVLDNCMGSGTTGVACIRTGRSFIGIEILEEYYGITKKRIEEEQDKIKDISLF